LFDYPLKIHSIYQFDSYNLGSYFLITKSLTQILPASILIIRVINLYSYFIELAYHFHNLMMLLLYYIKS